MYDVLIDLERLKYPHCGLGQICLNLGRIWANRPASKTTPHLFTPKGDVGRFGPGVRYNTAHPILRYTPWMNRSFDLWHSIHQEPTYLPSSKKTSWIMTVLDLNFLGEKSERKSKVRLDRLQRHIDRTVHLSTISEFSKKVMQQHLDVADREIEVVPLGISPHTVTAEKKHPSIPSGKFIFSLGVVRPKKNFHVLVEMLSRLEDSSLNLVISGVPDTAYATKIKNLSEQFNVAERVILTGSISDEERQWCLKNCFAFAFPSLFEGFGLPIIEAMSFGKPVFSSDCTSLPEVGGTAAYYWRDFHADSMADVFQKGMEHFTNSPNRPQEVQQWASQYSWENTADQFENIYLRVLDSKS